MKTRRAIRIGLFGIPLLALIVYANMAGGFLPWFILYVFVVVLLYLSFIAFYGLKNIHMESAVQDRRVRAGDSLNIRITLKRTNGWPLPWVRVKLGFSHSVTRGTERVTQLMFSREAEMHFQFGQAERGVYSIGPATMETGDVFGFVSTTKVSEERSEVIVHPEMAPVSGWLDPAVRAGQKHSSGRLTNESASVFGVRDYIPGDKLSRIHWGATARTGKLQTKAFELYVASELMFVPDLSSSSFSSQEMAETFELEMAIAASLMKHAYDGRRSSTSTFHAASVIQVPKGCSDTLLLRNLDVMAGAEPTGSVPFPTTLHRLSQEADVGTSIVVVSPCLTREMAIVVTMVQRRTPIEWFVPDPNHRLNEDATRVIRQLESSGVPVYIIRALDELSGLAKGGTLRGGSH